MRINLSAKKDDKGSKNPMKKYEALTRRKKMPLVVSSEISGFELSE